MNGPARPANSAVSSAIPAPPPLDGSRPRLRIRDFLVLLGINLLYSTTGIFTKMASRQTMGSGAYFLWVAGALGVLGLYAVLWQQVIARIPLSTTYLFRSSGLVFALLFAAFLWGEPITVHNIVGAAIMTVGITLYVQS